jgi:phage shock protein C
MNQNSTRTSWTVMGGIAFVALGLWLLLETFLPTLFIPFRLIFELMGRVGWPLVLIGLGVLLIARARGGGWNPAGRRLVRSRSNRMIGGVLGGFADFLAVDVTVLRVVFVLLALLTGLWWGVLFYVAAMLLVAEEPYAAPWSDAGATASASAPTPPPPAPPIPQSSGAAVAPPVPPMPSESSSQSSEPPQAPPVPPAPTVL